MGGILCCMSQPIIEEKPPDMKVIAGGRNQNIPSRISSQNKAQCMTLEDCLLASPNLNAHPSRTTGGEIQIYKHLPKRVYPSSSSPDISQEFFTPRQSFSGVVSSAKLGRIDEEDSSEQDGKVKRKVRFRMPDDADIYVYSSTKRVFEE